MTMKNILLIIGILAISSCAYQPVPIPSDPSGFFIGLLHGFIIVFSFIGSWFTDIRIYASPNSGVIYDVGFIIGILLQTGTFNISFNKRRK